MVIVSYNFFFSNLFYRLVDFGPVGTKQNYLIYSPQLDQDGKTHHLAYKWQRGWVSQFTYIVEWSSIYERALKDGASIDCKQSPIFP